MIEESSKRRVNAYIPKYISMAYYIMFLWIPERHTQQVNGKRFSKCTPCFHRFNRRYHVNKKVIDYCIEDKIVMERN